MGRRGRGRQAQTSLLREPPGGSPVKEMLYTRSLIATGATGAQGSPICPKRGWERRQNGAASGLRLGNSRRSRAWPILAPRGCRTGNGPRAGAGERVGGAVFSEVLAAVFGRWALRSSRSRAERPPREGTRILPRWERGSGTQ